MRQFDFAIKTLAAGLSVVIKPRGNSMKGIINSGDVVVIEPFTSDVVPIGSVVLVKIRRSIFLHIVKASRIISKGKIQYQIGNNIGGINGWVEINAIYGVAKSINDNPL